MSDVYHEEEIRKSFGEPTLILKPSLQEVEAQMHSDQIASEYWVFLSDRCAGGCIVYAKYDRGWVVNPSTRWLVAEMTKQLTRKVRGG